MEELQYPFDSNYLLRKKRSIRRSLTKNDTGNFIHKKIAVLCGSTANDIVDILQLFLLDQGIDPEFYISEYNKYWEDVMFDNPDLTEFRPDIIYIHTTSRNIQKFPNVKDTIEDINELLNAEFTRFKSMWDKIRNDYGCIVIQNNFEQPFYRLLGNSDTYNEHGRLYYINKLNDMFYEYARQHDTFYINDINYIASCYGIQKWSDPSSWYMYKYAMDIKAIPEFSFNLSHIIKSIYGKNKKAFALDMDNTLWGGVIGDDGPENIEIGQETPVAQQFSEFQEYIKAHKDLGIILSIDSKNYEEIAVQGLKRPDSVLKPEDFLVIKANWEPKDRNLLEIAKDINIGVDSFVYVDDNPAERHIVKSQINGVAVPEVGTPDSFIRILDRNGFFEVTSFSEDDLKRSSMYKSNLDRKKQQALFADYGEYLASLEMKAEIAPFNGLYMSRIAQLTNKSNQFNLTTRRCDQSELENIASDDKFVTLYGKLKDKFGDNGVVTVIFGHEDDEKVFHIDLWLMSCRVLKRNMEHAMMDKLVSECKARDIIELRGYYYPTRKNKMVADFYEGMGFEKISQDEEGNTQWRLSLKKCYTNKNLYITVEN